MESEIRVLLADDYVVLREATAELIDHQSEMGVVGRGGTGALFGPISGHRSGTLAHRDRL